MVSDADLQGLDAKIVALTAKVQSLQQSCRHMEAGRTGQAPEVPLVLGSVWRSGIISELFADCGVVALQ